MAQQHGAARRQRPAGVAEFDLRSIKLEIALGQRLLVVLFGELARRIDVLAAAGHAGFLLLVRPRVSRGQLWHGKIVSTAALSNTPFLSLKAAAALPIHKRLN